MKILAEPVDAVVIFRKGAVPAPYKFKYEQNGERYEIRIDKVLAVEKRRTAGIASILYNCQSVIDGQEKRYELKYLLADCRWELYKI